MWRQFVYSTFVCVYVRFLFLIVGASADRNMLVKCHDDPTYEPQVGPIRELQFTWLGTLQYIHIKDETPHYFRVPRVVLVAKQYTLCTAHDVSPVPKGYALGNVVFGEYERDEHECGLTVDQIASGMPCDPVMLLMPIADVMVHPEYSPLGARHSIALLKLLTPVVSKYMVPVCLPLRSYLEKTEDQRVSIEIMYHIDYSSPVPRAFADELKKITVVSLVSDELCTPADFRGNNDVKITKENLICTSGCGLHSGAPSVVHESTGQWTLVALSLGGSWCADPLIYRPSPPPHHLLIFPYLHWITQIITGKPFLRNDPFGEMVPRVTHYQRFEAGWVGHWWLGGTACYDRGLASINLFRFYHELFTLDPDSVTNLTYYIELYAPEHVNVKCVKVGMPIQLAKPKVWKLRTPSPKLRIPIRNVTYKFRFEVEAWGINRSQDRFG